MLVKHTMTYTKIALAIVAIVVAVGMIGVSTAMLSQHANAAVHNTKQNGGVTDSNPASNRGELNLINHDKGP
jgi:hypothetical protein